MSLMFKPLDLRLIYKMTILIQISHRYFNRSKLINHHVSQMYSSFWSSLVNDSTNSKKKKVQSQISLWSGGRGIFDTERWWCKEERTKGLWQCAETAVMNDMATRWIPVAGRSRNGFSLTDFGESDICQHHDFNPEILI